MFENKLKSILFDLKNCDEDKENIFSRAVQERLEKSLLSYSDEMKKSLTYLIDKNDLNLMKKLNRR